MKDGIDLTRLWSQTNGIRVESLSPDSDLFIFLRVKSAEMPASYLTPDNWFLMCRRLEPGLWEVGLREDRLNKVTGPNKAAVNDIIANLKHIADTEIVAKDWFPITLDIARVLAPVKKDQDEIMVHSNILVPDQSLVLKI